jgi:hypothetical protein
VLLLCAGCGGSRATDPASTRAETVAQRKPVCSREQNAPLYRTCWYPGRQHGPSTIERRDGGHWRVVADAAVAPYHGIWHGRWIAVFPAPDGRMLLAQWSGECEIPTAFFVPVAGGRVSTVSGEPYAHAPESIARGWARDGRARVAFPQAACGSGIERPGVYLVEPETHELTLVKPLSRRA